MYNHTPDTVKVEVAAGTSVQLDLSTARSIIEQFMTTAEESDVMDLEDIQEELRSIANIVHGARS